MLLTFVAEAALVLVEVLESHPLPDEVEELLEGGAALLVVVHLLLALLALAAVEEAHLVLVLHVGLVQPDELLLARPGLHAQVHAETRKRLRQVRIR